MESEAADTTVCQPSWRLLVVEDEPLLRVSMVDALRREGWQVDEAENGEQGLQLFTEFQHQLVITDLVMPRLDGVELLRRIRSLQLGTPVIVITAHGTIDRAVEVMREGATDFVTKPFSMAQLAVRVDKALSNRRLLEHNLRLQEQLEERHSFANMIGKSKPMGEVFDLIRLVAGTDTSVMICGESGTGKEMVAAAIHFNSQRRSKPYIRVSCASLPESLIEAELFGCERGAFTGATQRRIGRFEAANGGTLFLDEIGDLPLSFQVKLLRVLEERQIERLGSNRSFDLDIRIISATLRSLEAEIAQNRFREDLYFRVNTVTITLPPLRDRTEDIPLLANAFVREFNTKLGKQVEGLADAALELLVHHHWSGNVRELRNTIERAVLFTAGARVEVEHLPASVRGGPVPTATPPPSEAHTLKDASSQAEIRTIRAALAETGGRRSEAADLLGISRKTLWEKIKLYDISVDG